MPSRATSCVLTVCLRNRGLKLQFRREQRNRIQQAQLLPIPFHLDRSLLGVGRSSRDPSNHFDVGPYSSKPDRNRPGEGSHLLRIRKRGDQIQLPCDGLDVAPIPFEVDVLAREWLELFKVRIFLEIALRPVVDGLPTY